MDLSSTNASEQPSTEIIFKELYTQLGRMNDTLYRMPPFFATVIGGLWFFAAQFLEKDRVISAGVFLFATACAVTFAFALRRYQVVLLAYIASVEHLAGSAAPKVPPARVRTASILLALLSLAASLSLAGMIYAIWF